MVNQAELAQAFADAAAEDLLDLPTLKAKCLARIIAGGGELTFTISAGLNGKSGAQECRWDAADLLVVVNRAIATPPTDPTAQVVGITYADFSDFNIHR